MTTFVFGFVGLLAGFLSFHLPEVKQAHAKGFREAIGHPKTADDLRESQLYRLMSATPHPLESDQFVCLISPILNVELTAIGEVTIYQLDSQPPQQFVPHRPFKDSKLEFLPYPSTLAQPLSTHSRPSRPLLARLAGD